MRNALCLLALLLAASAQAAPPACVPGCVPPPAAKPDDVLRYWYTSDDSDGPSRSHWSRHLKISWVNANGDFVDAAGTPQGAVPFAQASTKALGTLSIPLDRPQAFRKGILLRIDGRSNPYLVLAGRVSDAPPTLTVRLADGTERVLPVLSFAGWDSTTFNGADTRKAARLSSATGRVVALFDIPADATSAVLNLTVTAKNSYTGVVSVFALDPPGVMYPHEHKPVPGIAREVADEHALKSHPDVIRADDFDLRKTFKNGGIWEGIQKSPNVTKEYLPDSLDPTRIIYRSMFKQRDGTPYADQNWRGSLSLTMGTPPVDKADPLRPLIGEPLREAFARMCFLLEADWRATNDANKMALGWDLRLGYWTQGGYWQQTTGNGGARGTGLKLLRTSKNGTKQWEYQGHSIRLESGNAPDDPAHPHDALRPILSYTYHLDQFDFNGTGERWGNAVIERARWHCIEQQIKINTLRPLTKTEVEDEWRKAKFAELSEARMAAAYAQAQIDRAAELSLITDPAKLKAKLYTIKLASGNEAKARLKAELAAMSFEALDASTEELRTLYPNRPLLRFVAVDGGYTDHYGNRAANPDGVLRTWLDGVLVGERTTMRWFRHPEMSIEGPWINWFYGGKQAANREMHYQMADMVLARRYIGLPNNFHLRNAANDRAYRRSGTK